MGGGVENLRLAFTVSVMILGRCDEDSLSGQRTCQRFWPDEYVGLTLMKHEEPDQ